MSLPKIVLAVFAWNTVTNYVFVSGQGKSGEDEQVDQPEEKTEPPPVENHTFVALIDILFVDGTKRQCTGTIIHDNVVVTAAHCFLESGPKYNDIELSGSFIVIGTKKMFDTGYENYLPIERIVTHPRYKGWTADIALVFTFAGMITDKPGYAMPLVGESVSTPVDSNVTILSWGRCADDAEEKEQKGTKAPRDKKRRCTSSEEDNDSCEPAGPYKPLRDGLRSSEPEHSDEPNGSDASKLEERKVTNAHNAHRVLGNMNVQQMSQDNFPDDSKQPKEPNEPVAALTHPSINASIGHDNLTSSGSPLMISAESKETLNLSKTSQRRHRKGRFQRASRRFSIVNVKDQKFVEERSGRNVSMERNWRRQAKPPLKEYSLTVETFGFVNVQTCKKLVDKVLPKMYGINTNEVVCYAADEHYISDDDSGAPAVRQGHLVAVTVGGVECEGDHVAVGMKMNCFCSWIAENLPEQNVDWKCCKDCCRGDEPKKPRKLRNKN